MRLQKLRHLNPTQLIAMPMYIIITYSLSNNELLSPAIEKSYN